MLTKEQLQERAQLIRIHEAIQGFSSRFDTETNRTLARTVAAAYEFPADQLDIAVPSYPIESVTKFETRTTESEGWVEQPDIDYLIRSACIVSLSSPLNPQLSTLNPPLARLTYTAGYVLPGATPGPGQTPLPADLEQAMIEQVAFWFQTREHLAAKTPWPYNATYQQVVTTDLLVGTKAVLAKYARFSF